MYGDDCKSDSIFQMDNPTDEERDMLTEYALLQKGRVEDFDYIKRLTAPPADICTIIKTGELKGIKIAVIGAGLAGLAAAFELRKTGAEITIFEAEEKRVGGRVYTYYFTRNKAIYGELGAMRIPVSHHTVWHYINLFKLSTRAFIQTNQNAFIYLRNTRVRNDPEGKNVMKYIYPKYSLSEWEKKTPWQQLAYYGLESPLLPANPGQRSELLLVKPEYNPFVKKWDCFSNRKIMEAAGLSQGAIDMLSSLSPLAGRNLYNSYVDIAQANYSVNLSYLYEIVGGTSMLPYAMYEALADEGGTENYKGIPREQLGKVKFKFGNWITGIHQEGNRGKVTLEYGNRRINRTLYDTFDYVICAIPFSTLRTVKITPPFSELKMQAIREVTYIASQKSLMLCTKRFWEQGDRSEQIIGGGSYTDLPITTIWYPSDHARYCDNETKTEFPHEPYNNITAREEDKKLLAREPGVLMASYNYSLDTVRLANLPKKLRLWEMQREVEEVHGLPSGYLDRIVVDFKTMDWNQHLWSRGALTFFSPEQKSLFSCTMTMPEYDNKVFMAGDHVSPVHRWMQGALQSGMIAANQLAAEFKKTKNN